MANIQTAVSRLASLSFAQELFARGTDCFGTTEVEKALGLESDQVPPIPFTQDELQRAKKLGDKLVLFCPKHPDGQAVTMQSIHDRRGNMLGEGKLLYNTDWYRGEDFFTTEPIATEPYWALWSPILPGSTNQNYLQQTGILAEYLETEVCVGRDLPTKIKLAIEEWRDRETELTNLMNNDWQKASEQLAALQLNQLRPTAGQVLYFVVLEHEINQTYLLPNRYVWTKSCSSLGRLVLVGLSDSCGVFVNGNRPDDSIGYIGACLSRRAEP